MSIFSLLLGFLPATPYGKSKDYTRTEPKRSPKHLEAQWFISIGLGTLILLKGLANNARVAS